MSPVDQYHSARPHEVPIVLTRKITWSQYVVELIRILGKKLVSKECEQKHECELKNGLTKNMLEHFFGDNVLLSLVWMTFKELFPRRLSGQGERSEGIHDQVDP